jgi:hypothetical protein
MKILLQTQTKLKKPSKVTLLKLTLMTRLWQRNFITSQDQQHVTTGEINSGSLIMQRRMPIFWF